MNNYIYVELSTSILLGLRELKRLLRLDEITFRTRDAESSVKNVLSKFTVANIVRKEGDGYRLNSPGKYQLKNFLTRLR